MNNHDGKKIGLGLGYQITKLEKFIMDYMIRYCRLISGFLLNKLRTIIFKIINHFKSSRNLSFYSKSLIIMSILLFLIKILLKYFNSDKGCLFNKKISYLLFLKNHSNSGSNKQFLFSEDKSLYLIDRNVNYEKLKKYIKDHKEKLKQLKVESKETVEDPYFKLMKFYLEYNNSHKNIKKYN